MSYWRSGSQLKMSDSMKRVAVPLIRPRATSSISGAASSAVKVLARLESSWVHWPVPHANSRTSPLIGSSSRIFVSRGMCIRSAYVVSYSVARAR